ncbi:MAG: DUF3106 domain-containing protein [Bryobacteraceae bacterium]
MPCDSRRSGPFRRQLLVAAAMLLATPFLAARAQQEPDKSTSPAFENSIDRWNRMSPEERERELAKLPPARARMIRQRIARYNKMNPEAQQALRERYQTFSQLPPDTQQVVRQRLGEFRHLPMERQTAVHRETVEMRKLPEAQRQARLNSDDFRSRYSPQEQQIIRDLSTYLPR